MNRADRRYLRAELEAELAEGVSTRRRLEIQRQFDAWFVEDHDLRPDDFVHEDGTITRADGRLTLL